VGPLSFGTGRSVSQVACGYYHTCVILDNSKYCNHILVAVRHIFDCKLVVHMIRSITCLFVTHTSVLALHLLLYSDATRCFGFNAFGQLVSA
jgi:hypothetical protein